MMGVLPMGCGLAALQILYRSVSASFGLAIYGVQPVLRLIVPERNVRLAV